MKQDIDRIKGISLDHIDFKLKKTSSTLINLEEIFSTKFQKAGTFDGTFQDTTRMCRCNRSSEDFSGRVENLRDQVKEVREWVKGIGAESILSKAKKEVELIVKQIVKYFTSQLSAKDNIISSMETKLDQYTQKIIHLQQEVGIKVRIQNKFCETMPNTKPVPSNSKNKYSSLNSKRDQTPLELISTELSSKNLEKMEAKSEMLMSQINQRKTFDMNLVDISEQIRARENMFMKTSTHRVHKREDSAPSLPKPLRKNSQQHLVYQDSFVLTQKQDTISSKLKLKTRRSSAHQMQPPAPPSHRNKPNGAELFKGKRVLLMASDNRGPELNRLLYKNR